MRTRDFYQRRRKVKQLPVRHRGIAANPSVEYGFGNAETLGQSVTTDKLLRAPQYVVLLGPFGTHGQGYAQL
jgi:hypothetical protein